MSGTVRSPVSRVNIVTCQRPDVYSFSLEPHLPNDEPDLRAVDGHPDAAVNFLIPALSCCSYRPNAMMG